MIYTGKSQLMTCDYGSGGLGVSLSEDRIVSPLVSRTQIKFREKNYTVTDAPLYRCKTVNLLED